MSKDSQFTQVCAWTCDGVCVHMCVKASDVLITNKNKDKDRETQLTDMEHIYTLHYYMQDWPEFFILQMNSN